MGALSAPTVEEALIERNMGLVGAQVKRYGDPTTYADLEQEGRIGLWRAIENHDPARHTRLTTYAIPMIRGRIQHYLRDKTRMIGSARVKGPDVESLDGVEVIQDDFSERLDTVLVVREIVGTLEPIYRRAIIMRYLEGMEVKDIAEREGVSPQAIWDRLARAQRQLRLSAKLRAMLGGN